MDSFIAARLVGPKRARRDGLEISLRRVVARLTGPFRRLGNRSPNAGSPFRRLGNHFRTPLELSDTSEIISGSPLALSDTSETISGLRLSFPTPRKPFPEVRLSFPTPRKPFPEVRSSFPTSRKATPAAGMSSRSWKQEKSPPP